MIHRTKCSLNYDSECQFCCGLAISLDHFYVTDREGQQDIGRLQTENQKQAERIKELEAWKKDAESHLVDLAELTTSEIVYKQIKNLLKGAE